MVNGSSSSQWGWLYAYASRYPNHENIQRLKQWSINYKDLNNYQEILLVGSGKGITSVETIDELGWKNQSFICSKKIKNIYKKLIL